MKDKIAALRSQGLTYAEIGKLCGCTGMNAWYAVNGYKPLGHRHVSEIDCAYKVLRDWMNDNKVSIGDVSVVLFGRRDGAYPRETRKLLNGTRELYKYFIDRLLDLTGFTYEEAFADGN